MSSELFTEGEQGSLMRLDQIRSMMTGVVSIFFVHPRYRLNYEDGTYEEAICAEMSDDDRTNPFVIVSTVQSKRPQPVAE